MTSVYGEIPNENLSQYFKYLVGKTFKILPLYEEDSATLPSYLKSYQRELIGDSMLFNELSEEPKFITLLATIEYLTSCDYDHDVCTNIINDINNKYFRG